ncbi:MAG: hypothetical protein ACWA42_08430 [Lutibacter sp.]
MKKQENIQIGENSFKSEDLKVSGKLVYRGEEKYYKVANVNKMRPFLMSVVSNANHWMFITSNGGLTAGRKDANQALFPYYTDDKIAESTEITGSKTIIRVVKNNKEYLWEPFSNRYEGIYRTTQNVYKSTVGNKIVFEEINHSLALAFTYEWNSSNQYGFIKKSTLTNLADDSIDLKVLDGIQNIVPYGVSSDLQNSTSNLVDAYKRSELDTETGIGIFALSAIIVDRAEPSEALKASIVWSVGVENPIYLLSSLQLNHFRRGDEIIQEEDIKAEKGAYFTVSNFNLKGKAEKKWLTVADVNQNMSAIAKIKKDIESKVDLYTQIEKDVEIGTIKLIDLVGSADGIQLTADKLTDARHFSNTMFNIMRGGIFDYNYEVEVQDFIKYFKKANSSLFKKFNNQLESLPVKFTYFHLKEWALATSNADVIRLAIEYLPLKFSRRHGDPSRPWNKFSINTQSEIDGSKILDYEGNWRDIFQNWEALAQSYPFFIEGMMFKFLNASTFDGYNPYRVTKDGFDWEVIEPNDPWSYIGYWGDHQVIYLLKFLEIFENYFPNQLVNYFDKDCFVYANVPYKIKSYQDILKNPKDTIVFDENLHEIILKNKDKIGADGALLPSQNESIYKVNLIEKLLATVLAKISNFIPEAGIWMNTQRPEWNDANNALVGNGVSMVTLYYLRRFLVFFEQTISKAEFSNVSVSMEIRLFFAKIIDALLENESQLSANISNSKRKEIVDLLGQAGSEYRETIYRNGFNGEKQQIEKEQLLQFVQIALKYINHSIKANKRKDHLYHAYNLMTVKNKTEIEISYLPEMLEGQVGVLSSGYLNSEESLDLLNALKRSALFRPDQYSYLLYPNKELAGFESKNNIPFSLIKKSKLLQKFIEDKNKQIVEKDVFGSIHFNGNFNNANSLKIALNNLKGSNYDALLNEEYSLILSIFEDVFNHKAFTGRSGTFYGYEGLGSIYWHMVSKLLLAVQETCWSTVKNSANQVLLGKLMEHYYEINEGLGVHKSPQLHGAFPTDPYSHTPAGKGAQQPGMTGQVKEDILSRFGELGVFVNNGKLQFNTRLFRRAEFLKHNQEFEFSNVNSEKVSIPVSKNSIAYLFCQIPIIYTLSETEYVRVTFTDGTNTKLDELTLDKEITSNIFKRNNKVNKIEVFIKMQ